jgi:hypothetical protein
VADGSDAAAEVSSKQSEAATKTKNKKNKKKGGAAQALPQVIDISANGDIGAPTDLTQLVT